MSLNFKSAYTGAAYLRLAGLSVRFSPAVIATLKAAAIASTFLFLQARPAAASCTFFSTPQRYNSQMVDGVIVIGEQRDRPYRVVITDDDEVVLRRVQACVLDAFITRSKFGPFIQVGSFDRRRDAEDLFRILRREGYNARVTYQR